MSNSFISLLNWPQSYDLLHLLLLITTILGLSGLFIIKVLLQKKVNNKPSTQSQTPQTQIPENTSALLLLAALQKEGRLVDFLQEDLTNFSDADVGVAARVVHSGGQKALKQFFTLEPVHQATEQQQVTLEAGFDPAEFRLTGNVVGEPPFTGTLTHHGWRISQSNFPQLTAEHNNQIIMPAEIEL